MPHDADHQQGLAAEPVHPHHRDQGGEHVDCADRPQRRQALAVGGVEAGRGEDRVGVVDDGVDAGQLLQHRERAGDDQRLAPCLGEHLTPARLRPPTAKRLAMSLTRAAASTSGSALRTTASASARRPPFMYQVAESFSGQIASTSSTAGIGGDAEHQPPVVALDQQVVGPVRKEDPDGDRHLVHRDHPATVAGRGVLGAVQRSGHRSDADTRAKHQSRDHQDTSCSGRAPRPVHRRRRSPPTGSGSVDGRAGRPSLRRAGHRPSRRG